MRFGLIGVLASVFLAGCAANPSTQSLGRGAVNPSPAAGQMGMAHIYLPGRTSPSDVYFQNVNGVAITEGDIVLGPVDQLQANYGSPKFSNASHATATKQASHLWPGAMMPFEIDASVTTQRRAWVEWAVAHVSTESVVKLRPRSPADKDYVVFTELDGEGCHSYVGRIGGPQALSVKGCYSGGSVVHEIGHASGFFHEQQRTDRDSYVTIMWDEIEPSQRQWFQVETNANDIGQYDYASIMHYSRKAFSWRGGDTIVPKDPNAKIGERDGLSQLDKAALAQLYAGASLPFQIPGLTDGPIPGTNGGGWPSSVQIPGLPPIQVPAGIPWPPAGMPQGLPQIPTTGLPEIPWAFPQ